MSARRATRRTPRRGHAAAAAAPVTGPASVDLLSPWVHEGLRVRALRARFAWTTLATLVLVAAAWGGQQLRLAEARAELRGEEAVGASLQRSIDGLAPVADYVAAVRAKGAVVGGAMHTEVELSGVLRALRDAQPAGTALDSVVVDLPVPGTPATPVASGGAAPARAEDPSAPGRGIVAACPGPDPFAILAVVGCVTLSGTAPDRRVVAELVRRLDREELFVEPFVSTTTTADDEPVAFTGSVGLSPLVFSGRYDALLGDLLGEGA